MVKVTDVVKQLGLRVVTQTVSLDAPITGGYASDLLSCVMAKAQAGNVWVTLQAHANVIAVASLLELACVIVTEGTQVEPATVEKADSEGIPLLSTPLGSFATIEALSALGVHGNAHID